MRSVGLALEKNVGSGKKSWSLSGKKSCLHHWNEVINTVWILQ